MKKLIVTVPGKPFEDVWEDESYKWRYEVRPASLDDELTAASALGVSDVNKMAPGSIDFFRSLHEIARKHVVRIVSVTNGDGSEVEMSFENEDVRVIKGEKLARLVVGYKHLGIAIGTAARSQPSRIEEERGN